MAYRTKTYIAAEWDGDGDLIEVLRKWNKSDYWGLHFLDAHELGTSRDTSLNCTIKNSLRNRLVCTKTFVLIVGKNTTSVTSGACRHCVYYGSYSQSCYKGHGIDHRSYIEFECDYAAKHIDKIIVLYNYLNVDRSKCPEVLQYEGTHIPAIYRGDDGKCYWNYQPIKRALDN